MRMVGIKMAAIPLSPGEKNDGLSIISYISELLFTRY